MTPQPAAPPKDTPKDAPKDAPKGANNGKATEGESKADRFRRIAGKRTAEALKAIEKVGATSRSTTYEYTDDQVDKIVTAMREQVDGVEKALKAHGGDSGTFAL
jgi:cytochrome c556